jgi:PKHD-type hydroxylase|tara:strand:- start:2667 stop:3290 length:624 start_codon:yes stop_codon:yes gene_type:complete
MIVNPNYFYFKKAVPPKTCNKILKACRKKIVKEASLINENKHAEKDNRTYTNKVKRNCKIAWINETWIYNILNPFINEANKKARWNFQLDWNESSQFTIYKKGEYYSWHTDQAAHPIKHENKNLNGKTRKLSLTLQLTDRTKYEGGDFQFMWLDESKKNLLSQITVDDVKDRGTIIVFPSFMYHQVLPITKGKRESLVNWSIGKEFK